ncbi:hypothetical protein AWB77_06732 [Caballeronia fortuita]|uniref:Uncharacterized protein n=1 Tax=Caballeronia fortuita TaxID=1777138 RepID=A0A158E8V9_9BURK|nr:hypothetical protein [Caballeronia fortuita]SAL03193.1 hypothetical protein AWB77_06732 [Caballeronia fortuita]
MTEEQKTAVEGALRELHTALCGVRQVGDIDGHGVIRRESVLDLVSQRIFSVTNAQASADTEYALRERIRYLEKRINDYQSPACAPAIADTAKPSLKDHARRFVTDFSRDVGFVMSDAQQEIMLNLFLKHAASAQGIADTAGAKPVAVITESHFVSGGIAVKLLKQDLPVGTELYASGAIDAAGASSDDVLVDENEQFEAAYIEANGFLSFDNKQNVAWQIWQAARKAGK